MSLPETDTIEHSMRYDTPNDSETDSSSTSDVSYATLTDDSPLDETQFICKLYKSREYPFIQYNAAPYPHSHTLSFHPATPKAVVQCTPEIAFSDAMTQYIDSQTKVNKKRWIYDILEGRREQDAIIAETDDFILLPDTCAPNSDTVVNWMVVFKDTSLLSIRNLNDTHTDMLKECKSRCIRELTGQRGFKAHQVMCYFHYLPSVFQLHLHVCAPYGQYTTQDIYKVIPIDNVISNIAIDSNYYQKATLSTVIPGKGELNVIYLGDV
eukprot:3479985-Rhodomonas_salina.7